MRTDKEESEKTKEEKVKKKPEQLGKEARIRSLVHHQMADTKRCEEVDTEKVDKELFDVHILQLNEREKPAERPVLIMTFDEMMDGVIDEKQRRKQGNMTLSKHTPMTFELKKIENNIFVIKTIGVPE